MREGLLTAENVVEHAKHIKLEIRPDSHLSKPLTTP